MIARRAALAALVVLATTVFVVGVGIERSSTDAHSEETTTSVTSETEAAHSEEGEETESAEHRATEITAEPESETLLGINTESWPLVILAAAASLAFAFGAWLRPGWLPLLTVGIAGMLAFGAFDVREIIHQLDENKAGLAALAGAVGALHIIAAGIALSMVRAPPAPAATLSR